MHAELFIQDARCGTHPSPHIQSQELDVNPARCVVIEDSRIGLAAAKAAGMRCVRWKCWWTLRGGGRRPAPAACKSPGHHHATQQCLTHLP